MPRLTQSCVANGVTDMTKFSIELTGGFTVTKGPRGGAWKAEATCDLDTLTPDMVRNLALHGLKQKIADAASGAEDEVTATAAMNKAIDAIQAGEWSSRGSGGEGVDEFTACARRLCRNVVKDSWGAKSPKWTEFTGLSDAEQAAKLDQVFADNEAALRPAVESEVAERQAKRARLAATKGKVKIDI